MLAAKAPDITLDKIKARLGLACTIPAIHQVFVKLGLTYKKRSMRRKNRLDVVQKRRRWKRGQGGLDPARLVFIDESAAKTNATRLRLVCHAPHGHWRTTTMIFSVHLDGTTACMTLEGVTNAEVFLRLCL